MLLFGLLALSLAQFIYRVSTGFGTYLSVDMPLFLQVAYDYLAKGELYVRAADLSNYYQPGAGVYKYPPLYQLTIVPWFAQGGQEDTYFIVLRAAMLLMYLVSAGLIITKVAALLDDTLSKKLFYSMATITALWFIPFHGSYGVVSEIFILFLVSLFVYFYSRRTFLSGIWLGLASMLKIYPGFLLFISLFGKNQKNIIGFIAGCLLSSIITVLYFGLNENIFFFFKLLPVLLSEPVSQYGSNMNIKAFLHAQEWISPAIPVFYIQRIIVLAILAVVTYQYRNKIESNIIYVSSMWLCAMLLLLSNYWLQYELILILPIIALLAHGLKIRSRWQLGVMGLVIITMSIDDSWSDILFRQSMEKNQLTKDMIIEMIKNNGIIHTGWQISPASVLIGGFSTLKVFIPHLLFILATIMLLAHHSGTSTTEDP